jgi:hypothetical protein
MRGFERIQGKMRAQTLPDRPDEPERARSGPGRLAGLVLPLYAATLFLSAFLLFAVEPLFAKMALPLLGGAPSVWVTAMMFYQAMLLAGYAFAHLSARLIGVRRQALVYVALILLGATALPVGLAAGWRPDGGEAPTLWLIGLMAASIGAPFFALSASGPMLQFWFAHTRHKLASDPYFLYAASNIGSVGALVLYPFLIEPMARLETQSIAWSLLYGVLALLVIACGIALHAQFRDAPMPATAARPAPSTVTWRDRLWWTALAFAPSSLLLGATSYITTDVAAVPLLWLLPLTLYLLSFVLVFARRPLFSHRWILRIQPFVVIPLVVLFWVKLPLWMALPLHGVVLFASAMACHGELAARRPPARDLTAFYLWMSLGGLLGGVFNALVAPIAFNGIYEYPIALVIACMLLPRRAATRVLAPRRLDLVLFAALLLAVFAMASLEGFRLTDFGILGTVAFFVPAIALLAGFRLLPVRFGLAIGMFVFVTAFAMGKGDTVARWRSFFGVYEVRAEAGFNVLISGTTQHGAQNRDPARRREPASYYYRGGPIGQLFSALDGTKRVGRVGVVGLGVGTLACYRRPGQKWTFYEIDPLVVRIARNGRYFDYLANCAPDAGIVVGDARLALARAPDSAYDLLIVDAFTSEAIPIHMVTREALRLYMAKTAAGGLVVLHISNRMLDIAPVIGRIAAELGLSARIQRHFLPDMPRHGLARSPSVWVVVGRDPQDLAFLARDGRWPELLPDASAALWTDDYSNILGAIAW